MAKSIELSPKYQVCIDARKKFHLSHAHIQMARELDMNTKKFGKLANHTQQPWKAPLPIFIEDLYFKRFRKERPENIRSIEQMVNDRKQKQQERKQRRLEQQDVETRNKESQQDGPAHVESAAAPST